MKAVFRFPRQRPSLAVLVGFGKVQPADLLAWMFPEQSPNAEPETVSEAPVKRPRHKA